MNKTKIINSNKKMNDWRLQLAEDLKLAAENIRKMRNRVFSFDAVVDEFKRVAHKDIQINNYTLGINMNGVYFLDNNKNENYLFLIIKTEELIPVDDNTRRWDIITVNDYLINLTNTIINSQVEKIVYEIKVTEKKQKDLKKKMEKTLRFLERLNENYKETIKLGFQKVVDDINPLNLNISLISPSKKETNKIIGKSCVTLDDED